MRLLPDTPTAQASDDELNAEYKMLMGDARARYAELLSEVGHLGTLLFRPDPVTYQRSASLLRQVRAVQSETAAVSDHIARIHELWHRRTP